MRQMYIILSEVGWGWFLVAMSYLLFRLSWTVERDTRPSSTEAVEKHEHE